MSTDDSFSRVASLESALEAEKASHTDTLVKLRLTEERLAASEAERARLQQEIEQDDDALDHAWELLEPWTVTLDRIHYPIRRLIRDLKSAKEVAEIRKRDVTEVEQTLWRIHLLVTGKDSVSGNYSECEREIVEALAIERQCASPAYVYGNTTNEPHGSVIGGVNGSGEFVYVGDDDAPTEPMAAKEQT